MFAKILCANDGSERAFRALRLAIKLARENGSELHMVSVEARKQTFVPMISMSALCQKAA